MTHLHAEVLDAIAAEREDLVDATDLAHLDDCAVCAAWVEHTRRELSETSVALRRAVPDPVELDAMIARAMSRADDDVLAPSRRSLKIGAAVGGLAAAAFALLSLPNSPSLSTLGSIGRQGITLTRAAGALVALVPGGWASIALIGLGIAVALWVPTRALLGPRSWRRPPMIGSTLAALLFALGTFAASGFVTGTARAYTLDGEWPDPQPTVTLDVEDQPVRDVLREAVESAGLGFVIERPEAMDLSRTVTLHVRDAPIGEVIAVLLADDAVLVRPGARIITIRPEAVPQTENADGVGLDPRGPRPVVVPVPPTPPIPAPPAPPPLGVHAPDGDAPAELSALLDIPLPPAGVSDRVTFGGDVEIGRDEQVRGVITMGGDATVRGRAFGDIVTMGGDAEIDGLVVGNVTTMGGDIDIEEGAVIHGDLNAMGGHIDVSDGARVHGQMLSQSQGTSADHGPGANHAPEDGPLAGLFRWALWSVLVFLLGLVMMGTAPRRIAMVRAELHSRPLRSMFGGMFGALGAVVLAAVLAVTILGIPGAIVISVLLFCGVWFGWTSAAWWLGSVLPIKRLQDRPVLQLVTGVGVLFVIGLLPKIGFLLVLVAIFAGLGAVIATKFGKTPVNAPKPEPVQVGPFRTDARL